MKQSSALDGSVCLCCVVVTIMGNNYIYVLVNVGCVTRHSGTCVCVCGSLSGVSECIAVGVKSLFR